MKQFFNPLSRILTLLLSVGLCLACSDKWNEHYSVGSSVPQSTVLDMLAGNENTSKFVEVLNTTNILVGDKRSDRTYAMLLDGDQFFTLWVPLNSSLDNDEWNKYTKANKTAEENVETVQKFLNNHMSRVKYSNDGKTKTVVTMSNKHYQMNGTDIDGALYGECNIPCVNGIIHTLKTPLDYRFNLYEYLTSDESPYAENLGAFLKKYTKKELNKEKSISAGYFNENDEEVYADSVMEVTSVVMDMFGYINREDSVFNMILPVGEKWNDALREASAYYHFGEGVKADSDSLTSFWSNNALLTDAVFNMNSRMQPYNKPESGMRMVSTSYDLVNDPGKRIQYHLYEKPFEQDKQFHFVDSIKCSNGMLYMCEEWPFDPFYTYAKPVVIEGEDEGKIITYSSNAVKHTVTNQMPFEIGGVTYRVSDDKIMRLNATNSYNVIYRVAENLSGWNSFYVVIAPNNITRDKSGMNAIKNQISVSCKILNTNEIVFNKDDKGKQSKFLTNVEKLDTIHVGTFFFPDCYYGLNTANIQMTLQSTVTSTMSKTQYSKEIYLDCIIVKPTVAPLVEE